MQPAGGYLFLLGLAGGLAILPLTAYARVTPGWVRWLLMAAGIFTAGRYVALAYIMMFAGGPVEIGQLWFGSTVGLTLPSVFAVDALVRHPAMTPKKLLLRFSPFLAAYAALLLFARGDVIVYRIAQGSTVIPDRVFLLAPVWRMFAFVVQALFVIGFVGLCLLLVKKIPVQAIQSALLILAAAHSYLGVVGLLLATRGWWFTAPFLAPEMLVLLALWYAFQIADSLR